MSIGRHFPMQPRLKTQRTSPGEWVCRIFDFCGTLKHIVTGGSEKKVLVKARQLKAQMMVRLRKERDRFLAANKDKKWTGGGDGIYPPTGAVRLGC